MTKYCFGGDEGGVESEKIFFDGGGVGWRVREDCLGIYWGGIE